MRLMETLIRTITPEQPFFRVTAPPPASPSAYSRPALRVITTTWTMAMSHFNGERNQIRLAEMYCGCVRERLLDEMQFVTRPSSVILGDVLRRARPVAAVAEAFAQLSPTAFDDSYARLRMEYAIHDVDIDNVAEALNHVIDVMRYVTSHR